MHWLPAMQFHQVEFPSKKRKNNIVCSAKLQAHCCLLSEIILLLKLFSTCSNVFSHFQLGDKYCHRWWQNKDLYLKCRVEWMNVTIRLALLLFLRTTRGIPFQSLTPHTQKSTTPFCFAIIMWKHQIRLSTTTTVLLWRSDFPGIAALYTVTSTMIIFVELHSVSKY